MFTLSSARGAIGNPAYFARGGSDVREGRVGGVTISEENGMLVYRGAVHGGAEEYRSSFVYDAQEDKFVQCGCTCGAAGRTSFGCRHVAALMIAVCGGAGEVVSPQEGSEFIDTLLGENRGSSLALRSAQNNPVKLYVQLHRVSGTQVMLSLRLGRTRPYVVRSMAEFAARAARRELTVYGRELTFSHREAEVDVQDTALFGQIVMLAGDGETAKGGELSLEGAALDQMMRLLADREVEVHEDNGDTRRVVVRRGALQLPIELENQDGSAQLRVLAEGMTLGAAGAYHFGAEEILCATGEDYDRAAALYRIAAEYPMGIRFEERQLDRVCAQLIAPAMAGLVVRKGQQIISQRMPTPVTPRLYVDQADKNCLICRVRFDYCGTELAAGEEAAHIRRNTAFEEDVLAMVRGVFPQEKGMGEFAFEGGDDACFALLSERLPALETAGEVMISEKLAQTNSKKRRSITFGLAQENDKLVLKADFDGLTQADLDAALTAYRLKRKYVRLRSGIFLSDEALEQAADAAQVLDSLDVTAEQAEDGAEVEPSRALYLDQALKDRDSISLKAPKAVDAWMERMRVAQQTRMEQPQSLKATLRDYQKTGLSWLCAIEAGGFGGILADDMGLGKTIQALAMLLCCCERGEDVRALVVCPASLQLNWRAEAAKFAPSLTCAALTGTAKERGEIIDGQTLPQLLITSYDQLRRDAALYQDVHFTHVLLDEAQNIKNAASQAAKAVKALKCDHRFAMTGTPIENRLSELWSIFDFLMPGYLLTYKKFKDKFEAPIVRDGNEKARENLRLMIAPYILRRMKKDVLTDLPEKVETVMASEMTPEQKKLYAAHAREASRGAGSGIFTGQEKIRMLAALTRLRQLCCDPRLCVEGYRGGSGKLTQLVEIVKDALEAGHHILLFSQFTSMLELIRQALADEGVACFVLTGETDKEERMQLVERFNAGEAEVFLISLKAGGTGLNLTGADVVIHYDPWWNVAAQNQATDRAYRIGQTKGVQVIRLIASDTVEERILNLQESKRALSDGVLLGEENLFTIDADTLRDILK